LKDTYYKLNHFINTKGRNDLVIHNGQNANSTVDVILETKKPTNKGEIVTSERLNAKAFQELVLYYLRERITHNNLALKHLIITNINEWFIFDATLFDRLFAQNKPLVKQFNDFEGGLLLHAYPASGLCRDQVLWLPLLAQQRAGADLL
jgi:adenine-specific DNA-methyltransferase